MPNWVGKGASELRGAAQHGMIQGFSEIGTTAEVAQGAPETPRRAVWVSWTRASPIPAPIPALSSWSLALNPCPGAADSGESPCPRDDGVFLGSPDTNTGSVHAVLWVVSAREGLWSEAADALGGSDFTTVAVHSDELRETEAPTPAAILIELPDGEQPSKVLTDLDRNPASAEAPRLIAASSTGQADAIDAAPDRVTDFLVVGAEGISWPEVRTRLRLLVAAQHSRREMAADADWARAAADLSGEGSWSLDTETQTFRVSPALAQPFEGRDRWRLQDVDIVLESIPESARRELMQTAGRIIRDGGTATYEHRVTRGPDQSTYWLHRIRRTGGPGSPVVGVLLDVTDERLSVHRLKQLAHFDSLTGLVTRHHFLTQLADALERSAQEEGTVSLLYLDLDGLKRVNDSLGHRAGDLLLRQTAERVRRTVRESPEVPSCADDSERPILGRMGGDEFIVMFPELDADAAGRVGEALVEAFTEPFEVSGKRVSATASIGLAASIGGGRAEADELVRHSDAAMYEAKSRGGNRTEVYRSELDRHHSRRREVRERLKEAIQEERLELHYQPRIELRTGRLVGAEALMRWNCPHLGRVAPSEFIPISEETGLIEPIGQFAIDRACQDIHALDAAGFDDLRISVNVSGAQMMEEDYGTRLFSSLQAAGTHPSRIELEVTESVALFGTEQVVNLLREIRSTGMYVSLDDFGTGYSSLGVLLDLPIDCMKLDQSLVREMHMNPDAASVIRAMILMAHGLGLSVVAEGVTEESQENLLRDLDCDEIQGFRIAPALPLAEFLEFARARRGS